MRVVIAAGGTGGHIYPALALADAIMADDPSAEILFIGTNNHLEAVEVPKNHYQFASVVVNGIAGSVFKKLNAMKMIFAAIKEAKVILNKFKPNIVIGFGGYVSVPTVVAAKKLQIPVIIHEQNAYAGRANLFLERYADAIVVCYQEAQSQFRKKPVYLLGNPTIYQAKKIQSNDILSEYGLTKDLPIVMFVMGSQGSNSINKVMINTLNALSDKPYQVLYVTGKDHYDAFIKNISLSSNIKIIPYVKQTAMLKHIDLLITRGGATTAAEICAFGVPSIIIPSPYVPNNHQEINAQALVVKKAAYLIRESELAEIELSELIDNIMEDDDLRQTMRKNSRELSLPLAAENIVNLMKKVGK